MHVPVRASLGLYARENTLYAFLRVFTCLFVPVRACAPGKPGRMALDVGARARSCPFETVRPENLAVGHWTCGHVPVRASFGLYARETWLYAPTRVCACPFVPVWLGTARKPGF